jgi:hypothetical protein
MDKQFIDLCDEYGVMVNRHNGGKKVTLDYTPADSQGRRITLESNYKEVTKEDVRDRVAQIIRTSLQNPYGVSDFLRRSR